MLVALLGMGGLLFLFASPIAADEFVFTNGEKIYGTMKGFRSGSFVIEIDNKEQTFPVSQIKKFNQGVTGPSAEELLAQRSASDPAAAMVQNASGAVTETKGYKFKDFGFEVETEKGFSLGVLQMQRDISGFYGRMGVRIAGTLKNESGFGYRGVDFRVYFMDHTGKVVASREFYIFRFPPGGTRAFAARVPGLHVEQVHHLKIVRRF